MEFAGIWQVVLYGIAVGLFSGFVVYVVSWAWTHWATLLVESV